LRVRSVYMFSGVFSRQNFRLVGKNATELVYADPNTYSGPDENPDFDSDDELVFMARHLGRIAANNLTEFPSGVKNEFIVEVKIGESSTEILGYIYFFQSDLDTNSMKPVLSQDAGGQKLVNYTFNLVNFHPKYANSREYFDAYKFNCDYPKNMDECHDEIMNPENSWFTSDHYSRHFSENW
jgi:hypothetical protein